MQQSSETWMAAWRTSLLAESGQGAGARHVPAAAEIAAGLIAALVTLSHCFSYAALMFSGPAAPALPHGLWALLTGAAVGCLMVALGSGLPPAIAGPRNAPIAVVSVLVTAVASRVAATGAGPDAIAANVVLALAVSTCLAGLSIWTIGAARLGSAVRFVPYPVIAGFLAASGWLLVSGGLRVALGRAPTIDDLLGGLSALDMARLAVAVAFVALVETLRRTAYGRGALPVLFFVGAAVLDLGLWLLDSRHGWYLAHAGGAVPGISHMWSHLQLIDVGLVVSLGVEIATIAAVAIIGLLLDASSLEAQRRRIADMDQEFRANGLANLIVAPLGGAVIGLAPNASRLVDQLGGRARLAGVSAASGLAFVLLSGLDITALMPTPILGGLLMLLGLGVLWEALWPPPAHRSPSDLMLAILIGAVIVYRGYLAGVILGLVAACLLFAVRYSRVGVVRRHVTRATLAAPVIRSAADEARLTTDGERIHVLWLSGFLFFGSSNRVFEEVRQLTRGDVWPERRWVVIDMSAVSGMDASAMLSFGKLRSWASGNDVVLRITGVPPNLVRRFRHAGLLADAVEGAVDSWPDALARCEADLLAETAGRQTVDPVQDFEAWLFRELGAESGQRLLAQYLSRRSLPRSAMLCAEGEAADTIEFVASGSIAITVSEPGGRRTVLRRMLVCTVVGEMGFFRNADRTASITAEEETIVYTLTRARYDRMRQQDPELALRLLEFVVRQLADRVEHANKTTSALL